MCHKHVCMCILVYVQKRNNIRTHQEKHSISLKGQKLHGSIFSPENSIVNKIRPSCWTLTNSILPRTLRPCFHLIFFPLLSTSAFKCLLWKKIFKANQILAHGSVALSFGTKAVSPLNCSSHIPLVSGHVCRIECEFLNVTKQLLSLHLQSLAVCA